MNFHKISQRKFDKKSLLKIQNFFDIILMAFGVFLFLVLDYYPEDRIKIHCW